MVEVTDGALTGYRVLDLTDCKGAYCTKLLADLGAEVIKIESPEGDPSRSIPPFAHDLPHPERSLPFLFRNANKRGLTLRLDTADGRRIFRRLVQRADVLVESFSPEVMRGLELDYEMLSEINPKLIMASITEFGQTGPYQDWKGSPIVDFALSGVMIESGFPEKAPCNLPGMPAYDAASVMGAISIVLALYERGISGNGHYIDVPVMQNSRLGIYPWGVTIQSYNTPPDGSAPPPETRTGPAVFPVYPCKDGFIRVVAVTPWQWDGLLRILGQPEKLCTPEWRDFLHRIFNAEELYSTMVEYTMQYTMEELFEAGHEAGVPLAPVYDVAGFVDSPQTVARHFLLDMEHPVIGAFAYPGPPYKWSEASCTVRNPAPCLGQHNEEIYCGELGFTWNELAALRRAGVV